MRLGKSAWALNAYMRSKRRWLTLNIRSFCHDLFSCQVVRTCGDMILIRMRFFVVSRSSEATKDLSELDWLHLAGCVKR